MLRLIQEGTQPKWDFKKISKHLMLRLILLISMELEHLIEFQNILCYG